MDTTNYTEKKISFIVTYFNQPLSMLCQCLDSILSLSIEYNEREIIVIDDGSSISPINQLKDYQDKIIYLRQPNQGLSVARNAGMSLSTGRYIQFVDGDDFLLTIPYNYCISLLKEKTPDILFFHLTRKESQQPPTIEHDCIDGAQYMKHNNLRASACGMLIKKSIIGNLRFRNHILHEDEDFTPRLVLRAEKILDVTAQAYFYRKTAQSITTSKNQLVIRKRLEDKENIIYRLSELAERLPKEEKDGMQRRIAQLTMDLLYNIMVDTHDSKLLEDHVERLYQKGFFPLPKKNYSSKYTWFRRMTKTKWSRALLCKLLFKK